MKSTVYFDLETGGLSEQQPNIQIAAVAVRDDREIESFERKIQFDEAICDAKALELNSYDSDVWAREAVLEAVALADFVDFLRRNADLELISKRGRPYTVASLGGHNVVSFDIPRLRTMAGTSFLPACWWYPLDTYHRAIWFFHEMDLPKPENFKLSTLADYFGIPTDDAHDALADVRMCAAVATRMESAVRGDARNA
jgi:DNA polymerase III epsilon subunit-like protein